MTGFLETHSSRVPHCVIELDVDSVLEVVRAAIENTESVSKVGFETAEREIQNDVPGCGAEYVER